MADRNVKPAQAEQDRRTQRAVEDFMRRVSAQPEPLIVSSRSQLKRKFLGQFQARAAVETFDTTVPAWKVYSYTNPYSERAGGSALFVTDAGQLRFLAAGVDAKVSDDSAPDHPDVIRVTEAGFSRPLTWSRGGVGLLPCHLSGNGTEPWNGLALSVGEVERTTVWFIRCLAAALRR